MALAASPPPTRGSGVDDARRVLLDELVADRTEGEPIAEPVLTIDPVSLDAIPLNRGRHRIEDVEEAVRRNLRSAEEARNALREEHRRLEAEAAIRRKMEREVASMRREVERMQESEKLRVAQARYTAEREARDEVQAEVEQANTELVRATQEIDRLRTALDSDRALMADFSDRLREEQHAKTKAQADADRAMDARRQAEHRLELATETAGRRADEELKRLAAAEQALREALEERDALVLELQALSDEGGRREQSRTVDDLEHLVAELQFALDAERARTDDAVAHAAELAEELAAHELGEQDRQASITVVEQLEAELEAAVSAHGAAVDRVRSLDEERTRLIDRLRELAETQAERSGTVQQLERELDTIVRERDELVQELTDLRTGRAGELASVREASKTEVRELEHLLAVTEVERDSLVQEAADLRKDLAEARAHTQRLTAETERLTEALAAAATAAAETAAAAVDTHELEKELEDAIATRDIFAKQVRALEGSLAESSGRREEAVHRAEGLERALLQEQTRVREAEQELRRLRDASVDARAGAAGRAEPVADAPVAAAPPPAPEEPEPAAEAEPGVKPAVVHRSAMMELSAIASLEDDGFRRRR
jgi:chromosome segregation ATPase